MPKRLMLMSLAVLLAAGLAACSKDNATEPQPEETGDILPLAVGNRWDYRVYVFPEAGNPFSYLDSIVILGKDTTDDIISYVANGSDRFLGEATGLFYFPASGGNWSLLFKYPAAVNDLWITGGHSEFVMWLSSKDARAETPYGDYTCYKYVRQDRVGGGHAGYFYVVPNVGIVQYEYLDSANMRIEERGQLTALALVE